MNDLTNANHSLDASEDWKSCLAALRQTHPESMVNIWLCPITPSCYERDVTSKQLALITTTDQPAKISSAVTQFKSEIDRFFSKLAGEPVSWLLQSNKQNNDYEEPVVLSTPHSTPLSDSYQIALPFANDDQRPITNGFLRSAFFGLNRPPSIKREKYENQLVATVAGYTITRSGEQLDQDDLTTWSTIIGLAAGTSLQKPLIITAYQLLKYMGLTDGAENYKLLDERLRRLKKTTFELDSKEVNFLGSLIDTVTREKYTNQYRIRFSVDLAKLYAAEQYTKIEWNVRSTLTGKSLAQWLHGYFSSHASPYPISVSKIHQLCGSTTAKLKDFKPVLKKALADLQKACNLNGEKFDYYFEGDLLHVTKSGTPSQNRHLLKKANQTVT